MKLTKLMEEMEEAEKISKPIVLYEGPDLNKKEFTCAGCIFFIRDVDKCGILKPSGVDGDDGCNLWIGGETTTSKTSNAKELVPSDVAGLTEGPFTCKRCRNFTQKNKNGDGVCKVVQGIVNADGCCNAWEKK